MFANRTQEGGSGNACRDLLPVLPIVAGSVEVRHPIIEPASINGGISDCRVKMRSFDQGDRTPVTESVRRDILPAFSTITCKVNQASVASRPHQIAVEVRWSQGGHNTKAPLLGILNGWWSLRLLIGGIFFPCIQ